MGNDVDLAMAGWQQLAQNPDKMGDLMKAFKDPDVWAKAQEMMKDPEYMAAAKAKMAELQAKAQANGLLDENGRPVPGAHQAGAGGDLSGIMQAMSAMQGGAGAQGQAQARAQQARDWELENIESHKAGNLNQAELGFKNLQNAMKDPSVLGEVAQMMKDPDNMRKVKEMMQDPTFMAQAQKMAQQMKASGDLPDFSAMRNAMGGMPQ